MWRLNFTCIWFLRDDSIWCVGRTWGGSAHQRFWKSWWFIDFESFVNEWHTLFKCGLPFTLWSSSVLSKHDTTNWTRQIELKNSKNCFEKKVIYHTVMFSLLWEWNEWENDFEMQLECEWFLFLVDSIDFEVLLVHFLNSPIVFEDLWFVSLTRCFLKKVSRFVLSITNIVVSIYVQRFWDSDVPSERNWNQ